MPLLYGTRIKLTKSMKLKRSSAELPELRWIDTRHWNPSTCSVSDVLSSDLEWDILKRRRKDARLTYPPIQSPNWKSQHPLPRLKTSHHQVTTQLHWPLKHSLIAASARMITDSLTSSHAPLKTGIAWQMKCYMPLHATCQDTFRTKLSHLV